EVGIFGPNRCWRKGTNNGNRRCSERRCGLGNPFAGARLYAGQVMEEREVRRLQAAGLIVVRVDRETWEALEDTRRHGARFTLNFRHSVARPAKARSLALIVVGRS